MAIIKKGKKLFMDLSYVLIAISKRFRNCYRHH